MKDEDLYTLFRATGFVTSSQAVTLEEIAEDYFKQRTCESCKYLDRDTGKIYSVCDYLDTIISAGMINTFYCSEWEKKQ